MISPGLESCSICHRTIPRVSAAFGICTICLKSKFSTVQSRIRKVHAITRTEFELPPEPPRDPEGIRCNLCSNECMIGEGEKGYCGLREVQNGRLIHLAGTATKGLLSWYHDPLPTNCVADWVCEGYKHKGHYNLAVFYESCTANCLFCQNWHFRRSKPLKDQMISAKELASAANSQTFCVCYFGGDPASQMPHALAASGYFAKQGIRICWETNGMMNQKYFDKAVSFSIQTGGCIKFDLKAFDEEVHIALTGTSNKRTLENITRAAQRINKRPELPLVIASTLLVPGYVEAEQVGKIAEFLVSINPEIPYALLAFAPNFFMSDLPCTSVQHAREAEETARNAGLTNVRIGNRHLLI